MHARRLKFAARILSLRWALLAMVAIWLAAAGHLHQQREQAVRGLRATAEGMAAGVAEAVAGQLRNIDQTLLYVRAMHARDGAAIDLEPWVNSAEAASRQVWPITIAGADGLVTFSDLRRMTSRVDISNLQPFRHFADGSPVQLDDHLFIGEPVGGRQSEMAVIPFARPLMTPLGRFGGIAMISLDARALAPAFPFVGAAVSVTGLDGIVRATLGARVHSGDASTSPAIAGVRSEPEGSFVSRDAADGTTRITGFRRIDGYPLLVEVALSADPEAAGLDDDRGPVVSGALVLSLLVFVAGMRCARGAGASANAMERVPLERGSMPGGSSEAERRAMHADASTSASSAPSHGTLDHLKDAVGTGAVDGVVTSFLDGLPRHLDRMRTLAGADDLDTLVREARTLAGSAAAIGLDQLAAAAGELEQDARHHAPIAIAARLDRIELLARPATARLDAYLHDRAA